MHGWALIGAIPAGLQLTFSAPRGPRQIAAAIFATALVLVFATSSAYHCATRTERARAFMQKLDHSMIYLLVGGTFTPLCIATLPRSWWLPILGPLGALAGSGIAMTMLAFDRFRVLAYSLYPLMALAPVGVAGPTMAGHLSPTQGSLILGGAAVYALGWPLLTKQRPNPWPERFGYHEIFHVATIVAAAMHYTAIRHLLTSGG